MSEMCSNVFKKWRRTLLINTNLVLFIGQIASDHIWRNHFFTVIDLEMLFCRVSKLYNLSFCVSLTMVPLQFGILVLDLWQLIKNRKWQEVPGDAVGGFLSTPISHVWFQMLKMSGSVILKSRIRFLYFTFCASLASDVINCYLITSAAVAPKLGSIADLLSRSMLLILRLTLRQKGRQQELRLLCLCHQWKQEKFFFSINSIVTSPTEMSLMVCQILTVWVSSDSRLLSSAVGLERLCLQLLLFVPVVLLKAAVSIESKHEVTILSGLNEFVVKFHGPAGSKTLCYCIFCSDICLLYSFGLSWGSSISVIRSSCVTSSCLWRWCLESASGPTREISLQIPLNRSEVVVRMTSQL